MKIGRAKKQVDAGWRNLAIKSEELVESDGMNEDEVQRRSRLNSGNQ